MVLDPTDDGMEEVGHHAEMIGRANERARRSWTDHGWLTYAILYLGALPFSITRPRGKRDTVRVCGGLGWGGG